jgi:dihydrofolate synthase/folylpolyglutamate synthase
LHPKEIDLGLERVAQVLKRLLPECYRSSPAVFPFTIITIAGTNGKGSTVAMLEAILSHAGYQVGSYTSPHLLRYNERIKINQQAVCDTLICQAFERIDQARDDISLSYFEFGTLAAIDIIYQQNCQIAILEVGLGGRLDAVNCIDPDIALVTTIDIDHQDWLGSDRETIGLEKAGIYRIDKPAIYGDINMPNSIAELVTQKQLSFYQFSVAYHYQLSDDLKQWDWSYHNNIKSEYTSLPRPNLSGDIQLKNASNVLMILQLLAEKFPVSNAQIRSALSKVQLAGRFQIITKKPLTIVDVAHNLQAVAELKHSLEIMLEKQQKINTMMADNRSPRIHVIMGMLKDKDVSGVLSLLLPLIHHWHIIDLPTPRAMPAQEIKSLLGKVALANKQAVSADIFANFNDAYCHFKHSNKRENDLLLVFGSFFSVSAALNLLSTEEPIISYE